MPNGCRLTQSRKVRQAPIEPDPASRPRTIGHRRHGDPTQRLDGLAVLLEHLLRGGDRDVQRAGAVGDDQAGGHDAPGERPATTKSPTFVVSSLTKTSTEADRVVPPHVGEHVGGDAADDDDAEHDEQRRAQRPAAAPAGGAWRPAGPLVGPLGARRTVSRTRGSVEPLRATHCSPRPAVGEPPCRPWRAMYPGDLRGIGTMVR